jgi:hypothetical protein
MKVVILCGGRGIRGSYQHTGFFQSVDNDRDTMEFEGLIISDQRPWHSRN